MGSVVAKVRLLGGISTVRGGSWGVRWGERGGKRVVGVIIEGVRMAFEGGASNIK